MRLVLITTSFIMSRKIHFIYTTLAIAIVVCLFVSCKKEKVDKIKVDNQFAVSLFSDTIRINDLLSNIDSISSEFIKVEDNGDIYVYYSDSVKNAVSAKDLLAELEDIPFNVQTGFSIPNFPPSPVEIPINLPFEDLFSIPFEYEDYEISSVVLKSGKINLNLHTDLNIIDELILSTDEIRLQNDNSLEISVNMDSNGDSSIEIDLTNCIISPSNEGLTFSVTVKATIPANQGFAGAYGFNIDGSISDIEFKSIDGSINDIAVDFNGIEDINIDIPNLQGDLEVSTPKLNIEYINTFGFATSGLIDSLYLTDIYGNKTSLINNWNTLNLALQSTGETYHSLANFENELVDKINILDNYESLVFNGNVTMSCNNVNGNMISDDSHIDLVAELTLPLKLNINNLSYTDTLDFSLDFDQDDNETSNIVEGVIDELEFKFLFKNKLPLEITPQAYFLENNIIIDSLFEYDSSIGGSFDNQIKENVIIVKVSNDKLSNIQLTDQMILNIKLSSQGRDVVLNANDYFDLKIGIKTKTSEIDLENF